MLSALKIQNYALIKDIEIDFSGGLNILTGETGAGKSIIIGALNIAVGEKAVSESIRTGEEKAVVEAVFDISDESGIKKLINPMLEEAGIDKSDETLVVKREINRSTKGKVYINNTLSSLSFLEKIGKLLIDIHGQHEHQSLLKAEIHIDMLDDYSGSAEERNEVNVLYSKLVAVNADISKLLALDAEKQERLDTINFRINEIEQANLASDTEYADLLREREIMVHTEAIKEAVNSTIISLLPSSMDLEGEGAIDMLEKAKENIRAIEEIDKTTSTYANILEDALIKAGEVKDFFVIYKDNIEFDKNRLQDTEDRIELFESLMKKYKKTDIKEIKQYYDGLKDERKAIELNEDAIKQKNKEKALLLSSLSKKCEVLSAKRVSKATELGKKIENELKDLGIAKGKFIVEVRQAIVPEGEPDDFSIGISGKRYKLTPLGIDNAEFLISLNPGEDVKPLVKVASGGEISRIMLAIKNILSDTDKIPVMVFDEIDTGISGKIAQVVGKKLNEISGKKQVICITHLPQIASFAKLHYSVEKIIKDNKTETTIKKLGSEEKVHEIAKLISGEKVTPAAMDAAKELIQNSTPSNT